MIGEEDEEEGDDESTDLDANSGGDSDSDLETDDCTRAKGNAEAGADRICVPKMMASGSGLFMEKNFSFVGNSTGSESCPKLCSLISW